MYYIHYPKEYASSWQFGYKQAITEVNKYSEKADHIIITGTQGRPYIYFLFYNKFDPKKFVANSNVIRDEQFFFNVYGFDKYVFPQNFNLKDYPGNNIYVFDHNLLPNDAEKVITIYNLKGNPIFDIGKNFK